MIHKLPLWGIRQYTDIFIEGNFKIIQTYNSRYVLDILNIEGNYWDRRLKSLDMVLPYKLYPISLRYEFIHQVLISKNKAFIDSEGVIIIYKPTRFVELKTDPIIVTWPAANGDTMIKVHNVPRTFRTKLKTDHSFMTYIKDGNKFYMYALSHEPKKPTRKKI